MKALIQRVISASVAVGGETVSNIDHGLCVLIGISRTDTIKDMEYIVRKILNVRLFDKQDKRWCCNVMEKQYQILCVSQFTLYGTLKGNKPDFHNAMHPDMAKQFYEDFIQMLKKNYKPDLIKDGAFGAYMQVSLQNDGPVTLEIESPSTLNKNNVFDKDIQECNN